MLVLAKIVSLSFQILNLILYIHIQYIIIMYNLILLLSCFMEITLTIDIWLRKDNIFISNNSNYSFMTQLQQSNQQLIPCSIVFDHIITNTLATTNQYFDYFTYLSEADFQCYAGAVGNGSYLFPCPFLFNNNSNTRIPEYHNPINQNKTRIKEINNGSYNFVVDNTPFPFPRGAFSYSNITISLTNHIHVNLDDTYEKMGIKLIFINITIILIYALTLFILIFKNSKTEKKMQTNELTQRESIEPNINDLESDIDNYEMMMHNQFSIRVSKEIPSMISSGNESNLHKIQFPKNN